MSLNGARWTTTRAYPTGNAPFAELSAGMTTADTLVTLNDDTGAWNVFWDEVLHYNGIPKAIYQKIENMFTDASVWRSVDGERVGAPGYSTHAASLEEGKKLLQQAIGLDQQDAGPGVRRGDGDLELVAGAVVGLVERQLDLVRTRIQTAILIVRIPAGHERKARDQARLRVLYLDSVAAPFHREIDARRTLGAGVDLLALDGFPA